ncbi:hypothetical protein L218DRAFT_952323 [Marasmius fiardii PR-910]|nr:hypothetical protein L218DRAFT_952323 [Marasmius fiardii PR-910]
MASTLDGAAYTTAAPFDFGVRLGIVFIIQAASLSALAVFSLLASIIYSALPWAQRTWTVSTHVHYYFVNLLVADLIQATGALLSIKWVVEGRVTEGTLCVTQGILKQVGDVGVALTSLAIAVHTFLVLILRVQSRPHIGLLVLTLIWLFIALVVGIPLAVHRNERYYGSTVYWCWITEPFPEERIALEYLWMWVAAFVNLTCYVAIAFVLKGIMIIEEGRIYFRRPPKGHDWQVLTRLSGNSEKSRGKSVALQMLFYPLIYIVTVFPIAVVRWMTFAGMQVPFAATAFSSFLFSLSGVFNVCLFAYTRPRLLPQRERVDSSSSLTSSNFTCSNTCVSSREDPPSPKTIA